MTYWDMVVDRDEISRTEFRAIAAPGEVDLDPGEVVIEVERFALTANNITYGSAGERLGYWKFFPAPKGWGRIPAWGFGRVSRSNAAGIREGLRIFGYLPMSTHYVTSLRVSGQGLVDASAHRAVLPATYNYYALAAETPFDDHFALLRPLFMTAFLLDDMLQEAGDFGASSVVLSSASSKTALGLAWLLRGRGVHTMALTSHARVDGLGALCGYDEIRAYQDLASLTRDGPIVFIDFAGDPVLRSAVHHHFGGALAHSAMVGSTHREARARGPGATLPGPAPVFFFAPDRAQLRVQAWGRAAFEGRLDDAMTRFFEAATWLEIVSLEGAAGLGEAYARVLRGAVGPAEGVIVGPRSS